MKGWIFVLGFALGLAWENTISAEWTRVAVNLVLAAGAAIAVEAHRRVSLK